MNPILMRSRIAAFLMLCSLAVHSGQLWAAPANLTGERIPTERGDLVVHPVEHATFLLGWNDQVIYVDPVGPTERFNALPKPTLILITDIHGDHLQPATLSAVIGEQTRLVAPPAVNDQLPPDLKEKTKVLANDESAEHGGVKIEAIPMYNLTQERLKFHTKGRGNGYLLTVGGKRIYISGDTEDIPEMRGLKNIDAAFLCMNLPFTMTVDQAAGALRDFRPRIVYPYHYRGSDMDKFKTLVSDIPGVDVRILNWYPKK